MKFFLVAASILSAQTALADEGDFDYNRWNTILNQVQESALKMNISAETINAVVQNAKFVPRVVYLDRNQPEYKLTATEYLDKMINNQRVLDGKRALREYPTLLARAEKEYGIPKELLVAFWGMESNYGKFKASFYLPDAFLSLIYDGRRETFFKQQLLSLMKTADKSKLDIRQIEGSWAGAMGHFQFIPTTLEQYGVDGNKNGKIDIIHNTSDAIMSAANYLSKLKYDKLSKIVREVSLPQGFDMKHADVKNKKPLETWSRLGVMNLDGSPLPMSDKSAGMFAPDGADGRAWLTYDNFDRIKKWNNSNNYALAVAILMERLK
ncbi:MAG: lytic murein transglycosylase [Rickettsiales bacterium]|nr:lytic murein transglycosylase [Rickettsiales bacterium]